jgi:hypothetical protein
MPSRQAPSFVSPSVRFSSIVHVNTMYSPRGALNSGSGSRLRLESPTALSTASLSCCSTGIGMGFVALGGVVVGGVAVDAAISGGRALLADGLADGVDFGASSPGNAPMMPATTKIPTSVTATVKQPLSLPPSGGCVPGGGGCLSSGGPARGPCVIRSPLPLGACAYRTETTIPATALRHQSGNTVWVSRSVSMTSAIIDADRTHPREAATTWQRPSWRG